MRNDTLKKTIRKPDFWGQTIGALIDAELNGFFFITYYVDSVDTPGTIFKIKVSRLRARRLGIRVFNLGRKIYFEIYRHFVNTPFEYGYVHEAWIYPRDYKF